MKNELMQNASATNHCSCPYLRIFAPWFLWDFGAMLTILLNYKDNAVCSCWRRSIFQRRDRADCAAGCRDHAADIADSDACCLLSQVQTRMFLVCFKCV